MQNNLFEFYEPMPLQHDVVPKVDRLLHAIQFLLFVIPKLPMPAMNPAEIINAKKQNSFCMISCAFFYRCPAFCLF
jgi:hypothetical protein